MTVEQRKSVRYEVAVSAEVYTPNGMLCASTRNLSKTGVCLDLNKELTEGSQVGVSLFLVTDGIEDPDAEPLNIKADVIWSSPKDTGGFSSGLRFEATDNSGQQAIYEFLSQME